MRSARLRSLSMFGMMKAVLYAAVGCACVAPLVQAWRAGVVEGGSWAGLIPIAVFGGVAVPLAWAGLTFVLVRREAGRDGLVFALLLASVAVAEGTACYFLWAIGSGLRRREPYDLLALALTGMIATVLGAALLFLAQRLGRHIRSGPVRPWPMTGGSDLPAADPVSGSPISAQPDRKPGS